MPEHLGGNPAGQRLEALGLVQEAAHPLMEGHRGQPRPVLVERLGPVRVPEEPGVPQPGREHALEVARHELRLLRFHVEHGEEGRHEAVLRVHQRKEMLVMDHGGAQHLGRQLQELGRERPGGHGRVLDEIRNLRQGLLPRRRHADAPAAPTRFGIEFPGDAVVALAAFDDDEVLGKAPPVVVEALDLDRPPGAPARREEPVAERHGAGADVLHERARRRRCPHDLERHDASPVEEQHPADGPAAQQFALAVLEQGVPAQLLRILQVAERGAEDARKHVHRGFAAQLATERQVGPLGRLHAFQGRRLDALLPGEAEAGAGERPVGLHGGRHRRPHDQFLEVGLPLRDTQRPRHQAPRRAEGLDGLGRRHPGLGQPGLQAGAELCRQPRQPPCRQLLGPDFNEQFSVHGRSVVPGHSARSPRAAARASASAAYSRHSRTASWRTRRM
ncbi:MAG: hypothetical protein R2708_15815 [Vicinamibacterales bacterium]